MSAELHKITNVDDVRQLKPREISTLKFAANSLWSGYGEGHCLVSSGNNKSCDRLAELGLVRLFAAETLTPNHGRSFGTVLECTNLGFQVFRTKYLEQTSVGGDSK